jgi:hypothetical protein
MVCVLSVDCRELCPAGERTAGVFSVLESEWVSAPGGLPVAQQVDGDALTVLHTVVCDWRS